MNFLDRVATRLGYVKAAPRAVPPWMEDDAAMARWSIPDGSLAYNQADLYRRLSWVQIAVEAVAQAAAVVPFSVKRMAGERRIDVPNHPFELLLQQPNPMDSRFELLVNTVGYRRLTGNSYWWLNRSGPNAPPTEIWPLEPHKVQPVPDGRMYLKGYAFYPEGFTRGVASSPAPYLLEPWEVVHFKRWNPLSRWVGLSPVEALATVAVGDLAAQQYNANFFGADNAKVPGALAFHDPILDGDWEKIKADVREQHGGVRRKLMMLRGIGQGGVSWVQMGISQKDMEFLAGRQFTKEEIFDLFAPGLTSSLSKNSTQANSVAGKATLTEYAVWPELVAIAEKITNDILPAYDRRSSQVFTGGFDDIRATDRALKLREIDTYARYHSLDEIRARFFESEPVGDERGRTIAGAASSPALGGGGRGSRVLDVSPVPRAQLPVKTVVQRVWVAGPGSCTFCRSLDGEPESVWSDVLPDGPPGHPGCDCRTEVRTIRQ